MPEHRWMPEFRDEAAQSRYPFGDDATLASRDGTLTLDAALFLDAALHPIGGGAGLYLSSVVVAPGVVTVAIGTPAEPALCTGAFDPLAAPATIPLADALGRPAGLLVADPTALAAAQTWPPGAHPFAPAATTFVPACTIPLPEAGLRGVALEDGTLFSGDVWLVGDGGVVVTGDGHHNLRIDVVGDPLFARRSCLDLGLFTTPRFVRTINGVGPDAQGNFALVPVGVPADTILRLVVNQYSVAIQAAGKAIRSTSP